MQGFLQEHISEEIVQTYAPNVTYQSIEFVIRKTAHVIVYAVLGITAYIALHLFSKRRINRVLGSMLIVFVIASADEFSQYLRTTRTGMWEDVVLDFLGGVIGVVIVARKSKLIK
ncbi:hypothetical protein BHF68_07210 [Desulfuribacillus alkaliarsenatis]|uniref:VanZ-like domain-containing protein n=1 Tax=Desulfuribacillus alkaliarsenatis TaxID=766136 RepID=A0A1E5G1Q4_9FIRM|nr:hypothetical protein BHF68_07210 [Desulfuribacillus alkaliarsenatis]